MSSFLWRFYLFLYNNGLIYSLLNAVDFNIFTESNGTSLDHFGGTKSCSFTAKIYTMQSFGKCS